MDTTISPASAADESVLRNLAQLYTYDFADIRSWELPDSGRFPDAIVDGCFDGGSRSRLTGEEGVRDMAELVGRPLGG